MPFIITLHAIVNLRFVDNLLWIFLGELIFTLKPLLSRPINMHDKLYVLHYE